eukprot:scaffold8027_cov318-Chaetoceros_neogracile.AAC.2
MIICPHGGYPLLVSTLATMAWMNISSMDGCDFARLTGPSTHTLTAPNEFPFVELGFNSFRTPIFYPEFNEWQMRYSDGCHPYDMIGQEQEQGGDDVSNSNSAYRWSFDFFWKIGSASNQIGLVLGGATCLFLWASAICIPVTELNWRILGAQLALAAFFHLGSFLWFFNSLCYTEGTVCHWFYGSNTAIGSLALYLFSSICIFAKYPEPTVIKMVRKRVEADFQSYEYTEATAPSEFDDASDIHSLGGFRSAMSRTASASGRQRSQNHIIV